MKQFVPFPGAAQVFCLGFFFPLEGIFNYFMATVFPPLILNSPGSFSALSLVKLGTCACGHCFWLWRSIALFGQEPAASPCCHRLCFYWTQHSGGAHYPFQHSICCLPPTPSPAAAGLLGCHHLPSSVYFVSDLCDWGSRLLPAGGTTAAEQGSQPGTALWK